MCISAARKIRSVIVVRGENTMKKIVKRCCFIAIGLLLVVLLSHGWDLFECRNLSGHSHKCKTL